MLVFAIVPVKAPPKSKKRLSVVLNQEERRILTLTMLEDVLKALKSSLVYQICVISCDITVQTLANKFEAAYISESQQGLNQAIEQAKEWCTQNGAESVLVIPADVPLITPEDINKIVKRGSEGTSVVISPSQNGGTNALFQRPPNLIPACFGPYSFMKHVRQASAKGISAKFYYSQRVAIDIDSSKDLKNFLKIKSQTISRRFLEQIKLRDRLNLLGFVQSQA